MTDDERRDFCLIAREILGNLGLVERVLCEVASRTDGGITEGMEETFERTAVMRRRAMAAIDRYAPGVLDEATPRYGANVYERFVIATPEPDK